MQLLKEQKSGIDGNGIEKKAKRADKTKTERKKDAVIK